MFDQASQSSHGQIAQSRSIETKAGSPPRALEDRRELQKESQRVVHVAGAEVELVNVISREKVLSKALEELHEKYDYVLIDCPPSLGLLTINALTAADSVLIPIQCEYYALEGLSQLLNTIRLVQKNLNSKLAIEGVLLTMFDSRLNLSRQVAEDVRRYFDNKVFKTVIDRNVRLSEAPSHGKPIILYDAISRGSENYMNLAQEIILNGR